LITHLQPATLKIVISLLKRKLSTYSPCSKDRSEDVSASVLVPVFENGGGAHIVLTKRSDTVKYHKGEISFPGGMYEKGDSDTLMTAMRECREEIGVEPEDIQILGRLDDMNTFTGFVITPYVGAIPFPYDFTLNPGEVSYLIHLPISYLLGYNMLAETTEYHGSTLRSPVIYYEGERIWGATCRILQRLKKILADEQV
jgi:8-oxo-dGTP pyrophosphatase MutT (NUDIX family)